MTKQKNEVAVSEAKIVTPAHVVRYEKESGTVENMILQAIEKGTPVDVMERVFAMRNELKAQFAKEQFDLAMANFQRDCPSIAKTKEVRDKNGKLLYSYAPIDSIVKQVKQALAENGLSYTIKTEFPEGKVKSTCTVKHVDGHSESSEMEIPLGTQTEIMSKPQVTAAASTFSKRYAFMNALGIMTGEEDKEENLTGDEAFDNEFEKTKQALDKCKTEDELKAVWRGLSKSMKGNKDIITFANQIKTAINENSQN